MKKLITLALLVAGGLVLALCAWYTGALVIVNDLQPAHTERPQPDNVEELDPETYNAAELRRDSLDADRLLQLQTKALEAELDRTDAATHHLELSR